MFDKLEWDDDNHDHDHCAVVDDDVDHHNCAGAADDEIIHCYIHVPCLSVIWVLMIITETQISIQRSSSWATN